MHADTLPSTRRIGPGTARRPRRSRPWHGATATCASGRTALDSSLARHPPAAPPRPSRTRTQCSLHEPSPGTTTAFAVAEELGLTCSVCANCRMTWDTASSPRRLLGAALHASRTRSRNRTTSALPGVGPATSRYARPLSAARKANMRLPCRSDSAIGGAPAHGRGKAPRAQRPPPRPHQRRWSGCTAACPSYPWTSRPRRRRQWTPRRHAPR